VLGHPYKQGFTEAMNVAFLVGAGVLVIALVLSAMLKEVPLRTTAAAFDRGGEEGGGTGESAEPGATGPAPSPAPGGGTGPGAGPAA
jgi:hypothetical protein